MARVSLELPPRQGRRVHPQDLHATLVFLGAVDTNQLPCVLEVAEGIRGKPFSLSIDQLGFWERPRVIWLGSQAATPAPLEQLVQGLRRGLTACGFPPEARPYTAHFTLARKVRDFAPLPLASPISCEVREFALVESVPHVPPPHYVPLKKWPLGS